MDQYVKNICEKVHSELLQPGKPLEFLLTFPFIFTKLIKMRDLMATGGMRYA